MFGYSCRNHECISITALVFVIFFAYINGVDVNLILSFIFEMSNLKRDFAREAEKGAAPASKGLCMRYVANALRRALGEQ